MTCPPELDGRMHAGVNDILEIFDAHTDYTIDIRISVLTSTLAMLLAPYSDEEATNIMRAVNNAFAENRQSLKQAFERIHGH